jgi:hypothetical protein
MRLLNQQGDSLGTIPDLPMDGRIFGAVTAFAMSDQGVFVGGTDTPFLDVYDVKGRRQRRIDLGVPLRATSSKAQAQFVDRMLDDMRMKGDDRARQRAALLAMPISDHFPAFRDIRVAPDGTIWVSLTWPEDGDAPAVLKAFGPDGQPRGESTLTRAVRLLEAGNDYLLLLWTSADGEPHVGVFRVSR